MFHGVVNEGAQLWQGRASAGIVEEKSRDIGCVAIQYALQLPLVEIVHHDRPRQPKEPDTPERRAQTGLYIVEDQGSLNTDCNLLRPG